MKYVASPEYVLEDEEPLDELVVEMGAEEVDVEVVAWVYLTFCTTATVVSGAADDVVYVCESSEEDCACVVAAASSLPPVDD